MIKYSDLPGRLTHRVSSCTSPGGGASAGTRPSPPVAASSALCAASWRRSAASSHGSSSCSPASRRSSSTGAGMSGGVSLSETSGEEGQEMKCEMYENSSVHFVPGFRIIQWFWVSLIFVGRLKFFLFFLIHFIFISGLLAQLSAVIRNSPGTKVSRKFGLNSRTDYYDFFKINYYFSHFHHEHLLLDPGLGCNKCDYNSYKRN